MDPELIARLLAILRQQPTPQQRQAYYDKLFSAESAESKAKRQPWTSTAPQHGFRGPAREIEEPEPLGGVSKLSNAVQLAGSDIADVGGQFGSNVAQTAVRIPEGALRLVNQEEMADRLEKVRQSIEGSVGAPKTKGGAVAGMAGTVAPFLTTSMGGGSLASMLLRGAAMDVPAEASSRDFSVLGMVADWRKKKAEDEGRDLSQFEQNLDVGADSPQARGLVGGGLGVAAGALADLLPGPRAARQAEYAKELERNTPPLPPLMKDADQAALDKILAQRKPRRKAGAAHPALVRAIARTGIGAVGGGAAASGEGGLTPLEGAALGAVGLGAGPALLRRSKGLPDAPAGKKGLPQHPTKISDLPPAVADDYDVTISSLAGTPEGVPEVVARAERLKPELEPKFTRGKEERIALAQDKDLGEILGKPTGAVDDVEVEALRVNYAKNTDELGDLYARQATEIDAVEAEQIARRIDELEEAQDKIALRWTPDASQAGRTLASFRALFDAGSPLAWIQKSQKLLGRALTSAEKEEVQALIRAGKKREASELIQSLTKPLTPKDIEFYTTFRKGSLLSSGVSIGRAVFGNTTNVAFNAASRPATVMLDTFASLLRSGSPLAKRSTSVRGTGKQIAEGVKGFASGFPEGLRIMASGLDDAAAAKLDIRRGSRLKSPLGFDVPESVRQKLPTGMKPKRVDAVDAWTQFWLRAQGAADRPFRNATIRASYAEMAQITARREGLKGRELTKRVNALTAEPTPEMSIVANLRADHIAFQNETALADATNRFRKALEGGEKVGTRQVGRSSTLKGGFDLVQPYVRTPSAIVTQNLEATPFGFIGTAMDAKRLAKAVNKGDEKLADEIQRRFASRGGRAITGSVVGIWLGAKWHREGKMLSTPPSSGSERTQYFDEGKAPFSVKAGNRWVSLAQLGPLGAAVAFGATLDKLAQEEESTVGQMLMDPVQQAMGGDVGGALETAGRGLATAGAGAGESTARLALETPFLTGAKEVVDALSDPDAKLGEKAVNMGASFVPNLSASRARATDPIVRKPEGLLESAKARIPGQSQDLTPSLMAASGAPKLRETPETEQKWWQAVMGSSPDRTKIEPILAEMESVGAAVGKIQQRKGEPDEMYFRRQQVTGQVVQAAVGALMEPGGEALLAEIGVDPMVGEVYRSLKAENYEAAYRALQQVRSIPKDIETAADLLEYVISRARGFTTSTIFSGRTP